jgi:hypothetical protein
MPFTGDTFTHLFDWVTDPQRQEKIVNARLEAEFDGVDTGLSAQAVRITTIAPESGQIAFPATQNPSADPNTLDDYEEGSWTPTITFAVPGDLSVTYAAQRGWYRKIGGLVSIGFAVATSAFTHTTASGNLQIGGLPFAANTIDAYGPCAFQGITKANYTQFSPQAQTAQTYLVVTASGSGQALVNVTASDTPSGGTLIIASTTMYIP